ncbi:hypothetical protein BKA70DRAFT_1239144 [Coprinopsis sp. MPI-PUGE-AT-0042]|nr:hypothetical protein BKA70DRAFT_1239144 [Coprinopsis sp. MPI-PUGE-AT-0042]
MPNLRNCETPKKALQRDGVWRDEVVWMEAVPGEEVLVIECQIIVLYRSDILKPYSKVQFRRINLGPRAEQDKGGIMTLLLNLISNANTMFEPGATKVIQRETLEVWKVGGPVRANCECLEERCRWVAPCHNIKGSLPLSMHEEVDAEGMKVIEEWQEVENKRWPDKMVDHGQTPQRGTEKVQERVSGKLASDGERVQPSKFHWQGSYLHPGNLNRIAVVVTFYHERVEKGEVGEI